MSSLNRPTSSTWNKVVVCAVSITGLAFLAFRAIRLSGPSSSPGPTKKIMNMTAGGKFEKIPDRRPFKPKSQESTVFAKTSREFVEEASKPPLDRVEAVDSSSNQADTEETSAEDIAEEIAVEDPTPESPKIPEPPPPQKIQDDPSLPKEGIVKLNTLRVDAEMPSVTKTVPGRRVRYLIKKLEKRNTFVKDAAEKAQEPLLTEGKSGGDGETKKAARMREIRTEIANNRQRVRNFRTELEKVLM